jgi:RNA polymerase sigma-70 factor (ECF subfamily)
MVEGSDVDRFEAIWREHYSAVTAYALRRVGNAHDAEDIAESTLLVAWRARDPLPAEGELRLWLLGLAHQRCSNHLRRRGSVIRALQSVAFHLEAEGRLGSSSPSGDDELFARCFARLRPKQQEVLRLVYCDGLSHADAARLLGCSANAFDARLCRARAALRRHLEKARRAGASKPSP